MDLAILFIGALFLSACTAAVAQRKGFSSVLWFFAGGLVPLAVVAALPSAKAADAPASLQAARRTRGNTVGAVILGVSILLGFLSALG